MCDERISVIIPIYNMEKYLERCIESVLSQTYKNLEVILIDDGSTDKSGQICDEYKELDSRIIVYHLDNGGPGRARNYALDRCSGDYITFVDSDDYIEMEMYEKIMKKINQFNLQIAGCSSMTTLYDGKKINNYVDMTSKIVSGDECIKHILYQTPHAWGAVYNKIIKKELFDNLRFPEISNLEDYMITIQLFSRVKEIYFLNEPMYNYVMRKGSLSKKDFSEKKLLIIDASEKIRDWVQDNIDSKDIHCAAETFVFTLCAAILWQMFRENYRDRRIVLREWRRKGLKIFFRYLQKSKMRKEDIKTIVRFILAIL